MSYPKPGGLVSIQLQSRVSNGGEFRNDGRAVPKDKPETHGTQNWCKGGQVQFLVLHFTKGRKGKRADWKGQRSDQGINSLHIYTTNFVKAEGQTWLNYTQMSTILGPEHI